MHITIGGSAQPNIGSKTKIFQGAAPNPINWGYGCPSNPLLTMWKEYNTTQHIHMFDGKLEVIKASDHSLVMMGIEEERLLKL